MSCLKTFAGALTLVLLASCGSSAQNAAPEASSVSRAIATTAGPTTSSAATLPTPTAPPTTAAPTTTTISRQDLEKVVRQAHAEYWVAQLRCIGAPVTCDPTTFAPANSPLATRLLQSTKELAEKKWIVRQNESDPATAIVESIVSNDKRMVATLMECEWDSAVTLEPMLARMVRTSSWTTASRRMRTPSPWFSLRGDD